MVVIGQGGHESRSLPRQQRSRPGKALESWHYQALPFTPCQKSMGGTQGAPWHSD